MHYTTLGRTGLTVSRIALGCMSYGNPAWRNWVLEEGAAQPFFRRAIEAGINFFDTADMYSLGVSEEITGSGDSAHTLRLCVHCHRISSLAVLRLFSFAFQQFRVFPLNSVTT